MTQLPRDRGLDHSLALLAEGHRFISNRCRRYQSDIFETRLMLRRVICTLGEEAAAMFYHPGRFTRVGAMPPTTLLLLQDVGSVQMLGGDAHHHRKQMFLGLMTPEQLAQMVAIFTAQWQAALPRWQAQGQVALHPAVREILCRAVCEWAGVPLGETEAKQRTEEFGAMIDGAGAVGPKNWRAQRLRLRTEQWARELITQVRARKLNPPETSALHVIAFHREPDGELLKLNHAAVELINVLRPTVAVARYIVFAALALHEHPDTRPHLPSAAYPGSDHPNQMVGNLNRGEVESSISPDDELTCFVQEVRRYYPFFPFIGGNVREPFTWRGLPFEPGTWVLLDIYGTNHDARIWENPDSFQPARFRTWNHSPFTLIPQGGGDHARDHRCPGEWLTIALTKAAVCQLMSGMHYAVPAQDLRISLSRMPALPNSRFIIEQVRPV